MRRMMLESATPSHGVVRMLTALCLAFAVSGCGGARTTSAHAAEPPHPDKDEVVVVAPAVSLAASSKDDREDAAWARVPSDAGLLARERTYRGAHNATQLRIRLMCRPATKDLQIRMESVAPDGGPSKLLSAAQRGGGYSVPVGRITWGTIDPAGNLWDYFHNEEGENVTTWRLDSSNYVASAQAPHPGDFIAQLLPLRFEGSNEQGPFVVTIPAANSDIESLLQPCATFTTTRSKAPPPSVAGRNPQSTEAAAVAAYVAQVLATVARNTDAQSHSE